MSIKDVVNKFNEFLSDHSALQVSNNSLITHTNICGGKYIISKEDFRELAKLIVEIYGISKAQDISIPEMANFHIVEKPTSLTNLHIDFDIKCKAGTTEHVYRELPNFVDMFISCMNQSIMQVFELDSADSKEKYLTCYVLEREALVEKEDTKTHEKYISDGLHIIYPYLLTNAGQRKMIGDIFNVDFLSKTLLVFLKTNQHVCGYNVNATVSDNKGNADDLLDQALLKNTPWFVLGCGKEGKGRVYQPTYEYRVTYDKKKESFYLLKRNLTMYDWCNEDMIVDFSVRHDLTEEVPKMTTNAYDLINKSEVIDDTVDINYSAMSFGTPSNIRDFVLQCISPERAEPYTTWLAICFALCDCVKSKKLTEEIARDIFHEFSKQSSKYKPKDTDIKFTNCMNANSTDSRRYTLGTIMYYAKQDNPTRYKEIMKENFRKKIFNYIGNDAGSIQTADFAKIIAENGDFLNSFIYVPEKRWYQFDGVIYQLISSSQKESEAKSKIIGPIIRSTITNLIEESNTEMYKKKSEQQQDQNNNNNNEQEVNDIYSLIFKFKAEMRDKINNLSYATSVFNELKLLITYSEQKFIQDFNNDPDVLPFLNGIYELNTGVFRQATYDDKNTFQLKLNYEEEMNPENYAFLQKFFDDIFPNKELREYVLTILAGFFEGRNRYQHFYIFEGVGSNGKSVLIDFLMNIFDQYATNVSVAMITEKRAGANQATPELSKIQGKRLVTMQEPDHNTTMCVGTLKELTGTDKITARDLYSSPIVFTPQASFVCACNNLPSIDKADDYGTFRRIKVIPFDTRFVQDYYKRSKESLGPTDRPCDIEVPEKLKKCSATFVTWILKEYYPKYVDKSNPPYCSIVEEKVKEYRSEYDYLQTFIDLCVIHEESSNSTISEFLKALRDFVKVYYPSMRFGMSRTTLKAKLERQYHLQVNTSDSISGIRIDISNIADSM